MRNIRLIRTVIHPGHSGPWNGQYALQKALRQSGPSWLKIGGTLRGGEIPWFWCWLDRDAAAMAAATGRPFVVGPNVLFENSRHPCRVPAERDICNAASCRLMFTESAWYRDLIEAHRGPANRAPIAVWPYPIDPKPGGPLPLKYDLLIYAKSGYRRGLIDRLSRPLRRVRVLVYGRFRREELYEAARRSRCCIYLSDDDRGPLALAEILLCGCPAIGLPRGAPFIQPGRTGVLLERFRPRECLAAIAECNRLDREAVAALADGQFDVTGIANAVLGSLRRSGFCRSDQIRATPPPPGGAPTR